MGLACVEGYGEEVKVIKGGMPVAGGGSDIVPCLKLCASFFSLA